MMEYITRHGNYLLVTMIVTDPVWLEEPFIQTTNYELDPYTTLAYYPCTVSEENISTAVPHFLPGETEQLKDAADWIPVIAPDVPEWLRDRKVKLLGLDLPSVDAIDAKKLINHYALAAARIAIVESLDLSAVKAGIYNLTALPLKIAGGDAGPVRALLWRD